MKIKRVEFVTPVPEPRSYRRNVSAVVNGEDGLEVELDKGMVILSREGFDPVHIPMTNVKCIISVMPPVKKEKESK